MTDNILIVVAHADDETIGMAGTIRKHVDNGDTVRVISMTDGVGSREASTDVDRLSRKAAAMEASRILGFEWGECHEFTDNALDKYPLIDLVKCIEIEKTRFQPTIVYTHSGADLNIDHRTVVQAVLTAFRPQPGENCREIRLFEVASATDYGHPAVTGRFSPNLFVNIRDTWRAKRSALSAYTAEMRDYPHSRSLEGIENLAKNRGNQVGFEFAEAFEVARKLEN